MCKVTILTDNNTITDKYLLGEPALSILIEAEGKNILFDTGYSDVFLKNAQKLKKDLKNITLAYAITIHKSQGSEFDVVIIAVPQTAPMLLTRNLLYTAITRAKKLLIILGGKNTIDFMIQNVDSKKRNTGLKIKVEHLLNGDN